MSEPNMDLWSSQEIMEYRLEKLSKEVERQRAVIEYQRSVIEAVEEVDRVSRDLEDSIPLSLSIALGDMLTRLDALHVLDGGDDE